MITHILEKLQNEAHYHHCGRNQAACCLPLGWNAAFNEERKGGSPVIYALPPPDVC